MGTKRSVLTDETGLPLSIVLSGANTHDIKLLEETLDQIVVQRPKPSGGITQNLCLDAGYTGAKDRVEKRNYIPGLRKSGNFSRILPLKPVAG
jgi:putative transposase